MCSAVAWQLSPHVSASEVRDPPSLSLWWCHRYHGDSRHRPEALPSLAGEWGGRHSSLSEMPPPFSPIVFSPFLSPRAISLRADCHLCSETLPSSVLDLSSTFLLCLLTCRMLLQGLCQTHVRDTPKLVHISPCPPPLIRFQGSHMGGCVLI